MRLDVTACGIAYYHSREDLEKTRSQDMEHATEHIEKAEKNYIWGYFKDIEHRLSVLKDCTNDMRESNERYEHLDKSISTSLTMDVQLKRLKF